MRQKIDQRVVSRRLIGVESPIRQVCHTVFGKQADGVVAKAFVEPGKIATYTCTAGNLPRLHERFRDHTVSLFAKHGMTNLAYWTLDADQPAANDTLVYLLAHGSKSA